MSLLFLSQSQVSSGGIIASSRVCGVIVDTGRRSPIP